MSKNINQAAMEVILNAGDGRNYIDQAFAQMCEFNFDACEELLKQAEEKVLKAHIAQTEIIQNQVAGEDTEYSLLFIHAQDTIMTINSEMRIAQMMLPVIRSLYNDNQMIRGDLNIDQPGKEVYA